MLALGALFLSFSDEYAPEVYSLLFGEVLGISPNRARTDGDPRRPVHPAVAVLYRPLMLSSRPARGGQRHAASAASAWRCCFLVVVALATTMTVPVVGTLLIFSLMIGAPAAARSFTDRPLLAMASFGRQSRC